MRLGLPDLLLTFRSIKDVTKTVTKNELIVPDDLSNNDSAEDILLELAEKLLKRSGIDKVLVAGIMVSTWRTLLRSPSVHLRLLWLM